MSRRALIVFGQNPVPGRVKTRLGKHIGTKTATSLYEAFLIDTLERCRRLDVPLRLFLSPTKHPVSSAVAEFDTITFRQKGRGLGERMRNAFESIFLDGFDQVLLIGSDVPTLPLDAISEAFTQLARRRTVVLGPAMDGGYYLVGLSEPNPDLFDGLSYGHGRVLEQTLHRVRRNGLHAVTIQPWYDVDTFDDLRRLIDDLKMNEAVCPKTRSALMAAGLMENASSG